MKTTPLTAVLEAEGGHFGVVNGWERLEYIKPSPKFEEALSFRFTKAFEVIGKEVRAVASGVGLTEVSGFNRFEITGRDALGFLDRMTCGRLQRGEGRMGLSYLLNRHGMIKAEATIANLGGGRIWYGSAAASEYHDMDWLTAHIGAGEDVRIRSLTNDMTTFVIAGPKARDVLSGAARGDWSDDAFPWLSVRSAHVGIAPAVIMRVSYSGELAYELHVPNASLRAAYEALRKAGEAHDMQLFGSRAAESMRLEMGFLHWKAELLTEFSPYETGLERFVQMEKEFVGKEALAVHETRKKLVTLDIDSDLAPAHSGASVMQGGRVVGTVTSGDWGHRTGKNIAMAFVDKNVASGGQELQVDVIGHMLPARVISGRMLEGAR